MSALEKTIELLHDMQALQIERVYEFAVSFKTHASDSQFQRKESFDIWYSQIAGVIPNTGNQEERRSERYGSID